MSISDYLTKDGFLFVQPDLEKSIKAKHYILFLIVGLVAALIYFYGYSDEDSVWLKSLKFALFAVGPTLALLILPNWMRFKALNYNHNDHYLFIDQLGVETSGPQLYVWERRFRERRQVPTDFKLQWPDVASIKLVSNNGFLISKQLNTIEFNTFNGQVHKLFTNWSLDSPASYLPTQTIVQQMSPEETLVLAVEICSNLQVQKQSLQSRP